MSVGDARVVLQPVGGLLLVPLQGPVHEDLLTGLGENSSATCSSMARAAWSSTWRVSRCLTSTTSRGSGGSWKARALMGAPVVLAGVAQVLLPVSRCSALTIPLGSSRADGRTGHGTPPMSEREQRMRIIVGGRHDSGGVGRRGRWPRQIGMRRGASAALATAVSELTTNVIKYARAGKITLRAVRRREPPGSRGRDRGLWTGHCGCRTRHDRSCINRWDAGPGPPRHEASCR